MQMTKPVLIMTRPAQASRRFADSLTAPTLAKLTVLISPLMQIKPVPAAINLEGVEGVVFSSGHGVENAPMGQGRTAFCVGLRTAELAKAKGWDIALVARDADGLVSLLLASPPKGPLLHLCGVHQRGNIAQRLTAGGLFTTVLVVYDQGLLPLTHVARRALESEQRCIVPLFSPRTAEQFNAELRKPRNVICITLSAEIASRLDQSRFKQIIIAAEPTAASMRLALETRVEWNRLA
tara:strand:+ start:47 stop:757 length:711 start_codon:yes stop_codon:yes gene_type:complete